MVIIKSKYDEKEIQNVTNYIHNFVIRNKDIFVKIQKKEKELFLKYISSDIPDRRFASSIFNKNVQKNTLKFMRILVFHIFNKDKSFANDFEPYYCVCPFIEIYSHHITPEIRNQLTMDGIKTTHLMAHDIYTLDLILNQFPHAKEYLKEIDDDFLEKWLHDCDDISKYKNSRESFKDKIAVEYVFKNMFKHIRESEDKDRPRILVCVTDYFAPKHH